MNFKKNVIFWLFMFFVYGIVNSQNLYDKYKTLESSNIINLQEKTDSLINVSNKKFDMAIKIAHDYSIFCYKQRNLNLAIKYAKIEIAIFEKFEIRTKNYLRAIYNVGRFYYLNFEYDKAISFYEKVISIGYDEKWVAESFCELGRTFRNKGDYYKAILFYEKGINILESLNSNISLKRQYINLAAVYKKLKNKYSLKRSIEFLKKADSLGSFIELTKKDRFLINNNLGDLYTYEEVKDFIKAKDLFAANLNESIIYNDSTSIAMSYTNLANLYNRIQNDSIRYFVKFGLRYATTPEIKARLYDNLVEFNIRHEKLNNALKYIHKSLEIILGSSVKETPVKNQIDQSILKDYTLFCLKKKVEIYLKFYLKSSDKNYLKRAILNVGAADNVVASLLSETAEESTQLVWRSEASQTYLQGAYAAHFLNEPESTFSFMEKNKALLLSESILKNTEFENLPKNVSDQEISLQKKIYDLENKLSKNENNTILQDSLFNAKLAYENYVDSLKNVYPKYFGRKIDVEQISLSQVQRELKNDEAVVSYIWNKFDEEKEILLGLVTTNTSSKTFEVANADSLRPKLLRYRELISKPFSTKEHQKEYQRLAFELYQELFPSQEIRNLVRGKNLTIIPDGDLQNIPFEAFITEENSNQYLILDSSVSYAYSYSFLQHNEQVQRETNEAFIGYSPVEFTSLALPRLKDSKREVEQVNDQFDGIAKFQETATKKDFLTTSSQSKIIHLATHSDAGGNPWIAFADEKLELHELYTYKNNADLVTLSACNTSLGEVAKGEGVLSLARGFFYSGSKSVVSSLWKVNDKSTSDIMIDFYKNIKEGQTKSDALNNAKRTYINSHELSEQSPYYWSSFILIGDAGQIDLANNNYLYLVIGFIVIIVFLFLRKKRFFQGNYSNSK